ncbi:MAG TPA: HD domain-containing phosphohydrolase [Rhodocyclaceae bacterium]|jgi:HD-GYP domain-containing protein (c-di-GMP phosphodiesterase class II)
MPITSPDNPRQLHWMLARRLGIAAILIGLAAGGVSYLLEIRQAEQAALDSAINGARHFESPAMQMASNAKAPLEHGALNRLLDRTRFVGIRVFSPDRTLIYETWENIPSALINAARSSQHDWPVRRESHQNWIVVAEERLIQIVIPLFGKEGTLLGYLEGVSRLDAQTLQAQREQARNGALMAIASVLITTLLLYPLLLAMLRQSQGLSRRLLDSNLSLIHSLGNAIAKRDSDTDAHNYRVTLYSVALAEALRWSKKDIPHLIAGAFLHDVGKIGIPDHILLKPGKLTVEEFEVMKTHSLLGLDIVAGNEWINSAASIIRHHHERFDGSGYPDGLRGTNIPHGARLFAVVDVFDALVSKRPYKVPMPLEEALAVINGDSEHHFDPEIVEAFMRIAVRLHQEVAMVSDAVLHTHMRSALSRYFKTELTN